MLRWVGSDELVCEEEAVFAAAMAWVRHDPAARTEALDQLLPLIRFPRMRLVEGRSSLCHRPGFSQSIDRRLYIAGAGLERWTDPRCSAGRAPATVLMAEPLVAKHPLLPQLLFETHPDFSREPRAPGDALVLSCPRLRPRDGVSATVRSRPRV